MRTDASTGERLAAGSERGGRLKNGGLLAENSPKESFLLSLSEITIESRRARR
jgi:hypothetical protein